MLICCRLQFREVLLGERSTSGIQYTLSARGLLEFLSY